MHVLCLKRTATDFCNPDRKVFKVKWFWNVSCLSWTISFHQQFRPLNNFLSVSLNPNTLTSYLTLGTEFYKTIWIITCISKNRTCNWIVFLIPAGKNSVSFFLLWHSNLTLIASSLPTPGLNISMSQNCASVTISSPLDSWSSSHRISCCLFCCITFSWMSSLSQKYNKASESTDLWSGLHDKYQRYQIVTCTKYFKDIEEEHVQNISKISKSNLYKIFQRYWRGTCPKYFKDIKE